MKSIKLIILSIFLISSYQFKSKNKNRMEYAIKIYTKEKLSGCLYILEYTVAAGEIIVRPSAALKELIENSIDAGSTHIRITVEKGGMRLIEISDNGHGISVDDYPILCERFTTSKITKFNDLSSISSFGFRGEALASISFVSRVEVLSRVEGKPAFKASFKNGLLIEDEEISESERDVGTTISAHNIFYNNPARKNEIKIKDEFNRIVEVIIKYSICYPRIHFELYNEHKHSSDDHSLFFTSRNSEIKPEFNDSEIQEILLRKHFGSLCPKKLLKYEEVFERPDLNFFCIMASPNECKVKNKSELILFINNRLVENSAIKKMVDLIYNESSENKQKYIVYMHLKFRANSIDVNVHPTKREVKFLNEEDVISHIRIFLIKKLYNSGESHTLLADKENNDNKNKELKTVQKQYKLTQILNTTSNECLQPKKQNVIGYVNNSENSKETKIVKRNKKENAEGYIYYKHKVRLQNIDASLEKYTKQNTNKCCSNIEEAKICKSEDIDNDEMEIDPTINSEMSEEKLDLIKRLQNDIEKQTDLQLTEMRKKLIFIGMISSDSVVAQYNTLCFLIKLYPVLRCFLYQKAVSQLYQFSKYVLNPPLPLKTLIYGALCHPESQYNSEKHIECKRIVDNVISKLNKHKNLLNEMFGINIEGDELLSLPKIHPQVPVYLDYLPILILKLGTDVSFATLQNEMIPFTVAKETLGIISEYYAKFIYYFKLENDETDIDQEQKNTIYYTIEHSIFPEIIKSVKIPKSMSSRKDTTFQTLTTTGNLYKIFERC